MERWGVEAVLGRGAQPLKLLITMGALENAYNLVRRVSGMVGDQIQQLNSAELSAIAVYREEGWL